MCGYIIRWVTYSNDEFLEGVSLTVNDELARWQKYAYGLYAFSPSIASAEYRWSGCSEYVGHAEAEKRADSF